MAVNVLRAPVAQQVFNVHSSPALPACPWGRTKARDGRGSSDWISPCDYACVHTGASGGDRVVEVLRKARPQFRDWVASRKSMKLIVPVSPSPTMGKMVISYQGFYKNEIASMLSWWHRTLCVNREHKNVASLRIPGVLRSFASLSCLLMARERHLPYWCPAQIHPSQGSIPILKTIKIETQGRRGVTFLRT